MQVFSGISPYGICHKYFLLVSLSPHDFYSSFLVITSSSGFFGVEGNEVLSCGILGDLKSTLYHGSI